MTHRRSSAAVDEFHWNYYTFFLLLLIIRIEQRIAVQKRVAAILDTTRYRRYVAVLSTTLFSFVVFRALFSRSVSTLSSGSRLPLRLSLRVRVIPPRLTSGS